MAWLRWYDDVLGDKKFKQMARDTGRSVISLRGAWASLLTLANQSPVRGCLLLDSTTPLSIDDVSETFHETVTETNSLLKAFQDREMIAIDEAGITRVINWNKRQFGSDLSTDRVKKHRSKTVSWNVAKPFHETDQTRPDQKEKGAPLPPKGVAASESQYSGEPEEDKKFPPLLQAWEKVSARSVTPNDRKCCQALMVRDDWDHDIGCAALKLCFRLTLERGDKPGGLSYLAPSIIEALESGKMPGTKRNGDSRAERTVDISPPIEEVNAREEAYARERARTAEPIDWANANKQVLKGMTLCCSKPESRRRLCEEYADDPAFVAWYAELAAQEGYESA